MPKNNLVEELEVPIGMIVSHADSAVIPESFLVCDGSIVSRETYAALFSAIGTTWGEGDASTTFHLPDLRGRFPRGQANGSAEDPDRSSRTSSNTGGATGDNVGTFQNEQFESHTHTQYFGAFSASVNDRTDGLEADFEAGGPLTSASGGTETRPKNVYVEFLIKY